MSGGTVVALLANSEHFRATGRAGALSCQSAVLHDNAFGVFNLYLLSTLHTVRLHVPLLSACR